MTKLLIVTRDQQEFYDEVIKLGYENLEVFAPESEEEIIDLVPQADIIFANPPLFCKYVNDIKDNIRVQSTFAGIDALVKEGLKQNYTLTNMKDTYGAIMSEYVFGYILQREKNISHFKDMQGKRKRDQFSQGTIEGKKIGILGTGSIGKEIARIAKAFGMETIGLNYSGSQTEYFDQIYKSKSYKEFSQDLDYLINVMPNTQKTYNFIDQKFRDNIPKHCYFINVGRGTSLNEEHIIEALENDLLSGAVLDVFHSEPLSKDSKLWNTKNLLITPHISGYTESLDRIMNIFAKNYERYVKGEDLLYRIDFSKGY